MVLRWSWRSWATVDVIWFYQEISWATATSNPLSRSLFATEALQALDRKDQAQGNDLGTLK
jgi:hypothetical protein